ncbi:hypothetical protein ACTUSQ_23175 [Pantoea ananatis]|uniref:hypothetical protein n=1 Tax=Pantoea ananas TaxID=553 RepID=UPI003FA494B9
MTERTLTAVPDGSFENPVPMVAEPVSSHPMADVQPLQSCRSEIVIAPESIRALGTFIDHLPAAGMFVLLLTLALFLRRFVRPFSPRKENTPQPEETFTVFSPPQLGSRKMAAYMAESENIRYWQFLLAAFGGALEKEGYALRTDAKSAAELPLYVRQRVGAEVFMARERYLAPFQSDEVAERRLASATEDGHATGWTEMCRRGAEAAGWFVVWKGEAPCMTDQELQNTPH